VNEPLLCFRCVKQPINFVVFAVHNKMHLKNVGPIRHASRRTPIQQVSLPVLSLAACTSMSTTTTTTRDRGDRYGPMEWAQKEAFEKCWAHSSLRAAARRITIHQVSLLSRRTPPAHRCPQRRRQRQRVTEGIAMAPWNGPNKSNWSSGMSQTHSGHPQRTND